MSQLKDVILAGRVAAWLITHGVKTTTTTQDKEGTWLVHYTLRDDIKPQPPVRIKDGGISFPKGSQQAVVDLFLRSILEG